MLRSAADSGAFTSLTDAVSALLQRRKRALEALVQTHLHAGLVSGWLRRLDQGLQVLETLGRAAPVVDP